MQSDSTKDGKNRALPIVPPPQTGWTALHFSSSKKCIAIKSNFLNGNDRLVTPSRVFAPAVASEGCNWTAPSKVVVSPPTKVPEVFRLLFRRAKLRKDTLLKRKRRGLLGRSREVHWDIAKPHALRHLRRWNLKTSLKSKLERRFQFLGECHFHQR